MCRTTERGVVLYGNASTSWYLGSLDARPSFAFGGPNGAVSRDVVSIKRREAYSNS